VERDVCPIAKLTMTELFLYMSAIRPLNKGYIAYFYRACTIRPHFHFRSKIWRHSRVPRPRFLV